MSAPAGGRFDGAPSRLVLAAPVSHEIDKIEGSRFVAFAAPVADAAAALAVVDARRAEHVDASHHCFAWRLSCDPRDVRTSDADEPAGSAGVPILRRIEGRALEGVVVVVSRWFGGTKLGVGGLVRAYGGAAAACLERAEIVRVERLIAALLVHDFHAIGAVDGVIRAARAQVVAAEFGADVRRRVRVPLANFALFETAFRDATRGQGALQREDEEDERATIRAPQR